MGQAHTTTQTRGPGGREGGLLRTSSSRTSCWSKHHPAVSACKHQGPEAWCPHLQDARTAAAMLGLVQDSCRDHQNKQSSCPSSMSRAQPPPAGWCAASCPASSPPLYHPEGGITVPSPHLKNGVGAAAVLVHLSVAHRPVLVAPSSASPAPAPRFAP